MGGGGPHEAVIRHGQGLVSITNLPKCKLICLVVMAHYPIVHESLRLGIVRNALDVFIEALSVQVEHAVFF